MLLKKVLQVAANLFILSRYYINLNLMNCYFFYYEQNKIDLTINDIFL